MRLQEFEAQPALNDKIGCKVAPAYLDESDLTPANSFQILRNALNGGLSFLEPNGFRIQLDVHIRRFFAGSAFTNE